MLVDQGPHDEAAGPAKQVAAPRPAGNMLPSSGTLRNAGLGVEYSPGQMVEYNSASQGGWIPAKVVARRSDGLYDLDCKPAVPAAKIRLGRTLLTETASAAAPGETQEYPAGVKVEYHSESQGGWILAMVVSYNPQSGMYNLDCKPNVKPVKIRWPAIAGPPPKSAEKPLQPIAEHSETHSDGLGSSRKSLPLQDVAERHSAGSHASRASSTPPTAPLRPVPPGQLPESSGAGESSGQHRAPGSEAHGRDPLSHSLGSRRSVGSGHRPSLSRLPPQGAPLQLVRVNRQGSSWHFEVNEEAIKVLESYGQRRVAICTVCGPYRTGKSYLLNLLLGQIQKGGARFRVGSTVNACTEGLWMWGAGDKAAGSGDGPSIIFMDCEGFGSTEADRVRDAKLMALCILLSSVFLLNTKGVLSESLFNALSLVCNLAEHVDSEPGQEGSRPALVWLLRDFVLDLKDEADRPITADQYLEQSLHAQPTAGRADARSDGAREVRETLLRFFPQRSCATLVMPVVDEAKLRDLTQVPYHDLRPEFRQSFEAMKAKLMSMAHQQSKTIGGQQVGGAGLAELLRKLVDSLNSNTVLNVASAWDLVQHNACEALSNELRDEASAAIQRFKEGGPVPGSGGRPLPVRDDVLAAALKEGRRVIREQWRLRSIGAQKVRDDYFNELKSVLAEKEKHIFEVNTQLGEEALQVAWKQWEAWMNQEEEAVPSDPRAEALGKLLDQGMPLKPASKVVRDVLNLSRMARTRWDVAHGSTEAKLKLLTDEVEATRRELESANRPDDKQQELSKEIGRLRAQAQEHQEEVDALKKEVNNTANKATTAQVAKDAADNEISRMREKIQDLEGQIDDMKEQAARDAAEEEDEDEDDDDGDSKRRPRCGCSVM